MTDAERIAELEAALAAEKLKAVEDNQKKLTDVVSIGSMMLDMHNRISTLESALKRIAGGWPKPMQLARETLEKKK